MSSWLSERHGTGSPEAVARPRFPQNVACGFPAPTLFGSCFTALQELQLPVGEAQFRCQQRCPFFDAGATDMVDLTPPRHTSTLPSCDQPYHSALVGSR